MTTPISPFRSLILQPAQLVQLNGLGRVTERTQLRMQQTAPGGTSLASLVEEGHLSGYGAVLMMAEGDLASAPRPLIRAGIEDLLTRRRQFAAAVASGLPLPPSRHISGAGMIRATETGHLMVAGCSELIPVDQGLPDWITSELQRRESSALVLNHCWLADAGFGSGRWLLYGPQRIS